MSRQYLFDRAGAPITLHQWSVFREDEEYRQVARTEITVAGEVVFAVSTVWIGARRNRRGTPLIFETAVFSGSSDSPIVKGQYATEQAAREGHEKVVQKLTKKARKWSHDHD